MPRPTGLRTLDLLDAAPDDTAPRPGADRTRVAVAAVTGVAAGGRTVSVSVLGSAPIALPAAPSTWTGVSTANILLDPDTGRPVYVLGPAPAPSTPIPPTPPGAGATPVALTRTAVITPTWSGTHRAGRGWNQWNVTRYGGRSDLYQGTTGASGHLTGLADYGDAIPALAPTAITEATLTLTGNNPDQPAFTAVIRAAARTPDGPAPTGPTATTALTGAATTRLDITALAAGLLAGAGLALVGDDYGGVLGVGASMSIGITYTTEA